jgi:hypothetical protein
MAQNSMKRLPSQMLAARRITNARAESRFFIPLTSAQLRGNFNPERKQVCLTEFYVGLDSTFPQGREPKEVVGGAVGGSITESMTAGIAPINIGHGHESVLRMGNR